MRLSPSAVQNTLFDHVVPYSFMEKYFQDWSPEILIEDTILAVQFSGTSVASPTAVDTREQLGKQHYKQAGK